MPVIDVHTHIFTHKWLDMLKEHGSPYNIQTRPDGQKEIFRGNTPVVIPQKGHFDFDLRIRHMNEAGIDVSIVSLTCPNVFWGNEAISCAAARETNDTIAEGQAALSRPDPLVHLAAVGVSAGARWRSSSGACSNGAIGVMVLANIAGRSLTDPLFAPIWAEIDRRALPVLVHPTDPPGVGHDGHDEVRPELVGRLHVRHDARDHAHDLRRLFRSVSESEDDRVAWRWNAAVSGRALRRRATRSRLRSAVR